jgi:glycosyltransferase involved in cell wall biosynthesis
LSAADVYVLPLLSKIIPFGGIGMLSVQALFCNTPIVGATVESFPEIERDKIGLVAKNRIEISEAIKRIIFREKEFSNLRLIAQKYYTWENISKQTAHSYKKIIEEYEV